MRLGERIRTTREGQGWTQKMFVKHAGIPLPALQKLEQGKVKRPNFNTIVAIARGLEVPLSYLTEGKPIEMRCETCFFFDDTSISKLRGFCRRYPPQVYYDPRAKNCDFGMPAKQPSVHINDWCGEWKPKQ